MKKKIIITLLSILFVGLIILLIINNTDAKRFKREYESLNNAYDNVFDTDYRDVFIDAKNPVKYKNAKEIISLINKKETFLVYFGDGSSHFCRIVIEELLRTLKDEGIDTLYYVNIKNIRDEKSVSEDGSVEVNKVPSEDYEELVKIFADILDDFELYDEEDKLVFTEKRIYDSTFVAVVNGIPMGQTMGISDYFTKVNMNLTESMLKVQHDEFKEIIDYLKPAQSCNEDVAC